jgi:hypothetical protein
MASIERTAYPRFRHEFWADNRLMIEVAPADIIGEYTRVMGNRFAASPVH